MNNRHYTLDRLFLKSIIKVKVETKFKERNKIMDYKPKHDPAYYREKGLAYFQRMRDKRMEKKKGKEFHYTQLYEIVWPREFFVYLVDQRFPYVRLKQAHPSGRIFKLQKDSVRHLYEQFKNYHNYEISRKSWFIFLKYGLSFRMTNHSGTNYAVCTPGTYFRLESLLQKIPLGGGLYFDGKNSEIVDNLEMPVIHIKKQLKPLKQKVVQAGNTAPIEKTPEITEQRENKNVESLSKTAPVKQSQTPGKIVIR